MAPAQGRHGCYMAQEQIEKCSTVRCCVFRYGASMEAATIVLKLSSQYDHLDDVPHEHTKVLPTDFA